MMGATKQGFFTIGQFNNMFFDNPFDYYQAIADELREIIAEPWTSIEVSVERGEESIDLEIVYYRLDGSEESDVEPVLLSDYFYELAEVISDKQKGLYKFCKFVLKNDGEFSTDFVY
jgi:hypothetical protein